MNCQISQQIVAYACISLFEEVVFRSYLPLTLTLGLSSGEQPSPFISFINAFCSYHAYTFRDDGRTLHVHTFFRRLLRIVISCCRRHQLHSMGNVIQTQIIY
jgi:putative flippase GtrA